MGISPEIYEAITGISPETAETIRAAGELIDRLFVLKETIRQAQALHDSTASELSELLDKTLALTEDK